jgi:fructuronate reductase
MAVIAAWIAASEARGRSLPERHFTDPLDSRLGGLTEMPAREAVRYCFEIAGFAAGETCRDELMEQAARYLEAIREKGVHAALAVLSKEEHPA